MKLIIFLGNPGLKYRKTRHNIGFMAGDFYAKHRRVKFKNSPKFGAALAEIIETTNESEKILLVKPQKFYNLTGEVVATLAKFYKIPTKDILVICDDLNLPFSKIRLRQQGSDGGNNGLKSIIAHLGSDFARLRIGTANHLAATTRDTDYVLGKFSRSEQADLPVIFEQVSRFIDEFSDISY
ncbi:aminoacyl-tRNA hydrolase [Candidatus Saccharibacteria bacterium]|nr:aminoacyl-tRNA hydrolase [Candidatus Saccharibacteria bacterium]